LKRCPVRKGREAGVPAFRPDGVVTAGTAPPLTDGAAALLVTRDGFPASARARHHHDS
jgi:acetyl-CoA acetyltransferase